MGWFIESLWLIWMLALLFRIPVLVLGETTPLSYAVSSKPLWRTRLLSWLLGHSQAILYIGTRNRDFFSKMGVNDDRLFSTPYSVDNVRFSSVTEPLMPQRSQLCAQFGLDTEMATFLFCGKLIPKKHPMELLEAYISAGLSDKAQLIFVGDGVLRSQLERRVQELGLKQVHFLGFLNQSQMPLAYVMGEVLCLISDPTETWGLVVNEAMACGRPVLVSDSIGCAADLVDETNGWVVSANDCEALARAFKQAYDEYQIWGKKGEQSLRKISGHTYSAMADGVISALSSLN
jgi:glycosyltransferase involved in cell wall biosynthesis